METNEKALEMSGKGLKKRKRRAVVAADPAPAAMEPFVKNWWTYLPHKEYQGSFCHRKGHLHAHCKNVQHLLRGSLQKCCHLNRGTEGKVCERKKGAGRVLGLVTLWLKYAEPTDPDEHNSEEFKVKIATADRTTEAFEGPILQ